MFWKNYFSNKNINFTICYNFCKNNLIIHKLKQEGVSNKQIMNNIKIF